VITALCTVLILVFSYGVSWSQAWYDPAWPSRKAIVLNHTTVPSTQTDFPVLIRLAGDTQVTLQRQYDADDLLFTSADGTTKLDHEIVNADPVLERHILRTGEGACAPMALRYVGTKDATYMAWQRTNGDVMVGQYNHTTHAWATFVLRAASIPDHHNVPALYIRTDGKILAVYTQHATDGILRQRISTSAEDISAWSAESTTTESLNTTYTHLRYLSGENSGAGRLYHFWRVVNPADTPATDTWRYRTSDNQGTSWSAAVSLFSGGIHTHNYLMPASKVTATRLHFTAANNNVGTWALDSSTGLPKVYHFYMDVSSGSRKFYQSDGTEIVTALPFGTSNVTVVYDGTSDTPDTPAFPLQAILDSSDEPLIAYTTYPNAPTTWAHHHHVTRWTGSAWSAAEVVNAGAGPAVLTSYPTSSAQPQDAAGIVFDWANPDVVYVGVEVGTDSWSLKKYTWGGVSWSETSTITTRVGKHHYFLSPWNYSTELQLTWGEGYYDYYTRDGSGILLEDQDMWTYPQTVSASTLTVAYVKVPAVSSATDTTLYLYYGNAAATNQQHATGVWDSHYLGVWHGRDLETDATKIKDSTSNAAHFVKQSAQTLTAPHEYTGKFARGQRFAHLTANNEASIAAGINIAGKTALHLESWFFYDTQTPSDIQEILGSYPTVLNKGAMLLRLSPALTHRLLFGVVTEPDTNTFINPPANDVVLTLDAWNFLEGIFTGATSMRVAINNVVGVTTNAGGAAVDATTAGPLYLGRRASTATGYLLADNIVEHLRLSDVERSRDWMSTQYANHNNFVGFATIGTQEVLPGNTTKVALTGKVTLTGKVALSPL